MDFLAIIVFMLFAPVTAVALVVAVCVAVRRHYQEKAEDAASIARIQAGVQETWPPPPNKYQGE